MFVCQAFFILSKQQRKTNNTISLHEYVNGGGYVAILDKIALCKITKVLIENGGCFVQCAKSVSCYLQNISNMLQFS